MQANAVRTKARQAVPALAAGCNRQELVRCMSVSLSVGLQFWKTECSLLLVHVRFSRCAVSSSAARNRALGHEATCLSRGRLEI